MLAEQVTAAMVVAALAVLACVVATQRTRSSGARLKAGGGVPSTVTATSCSGLRSQAAASRAKTTTSCTSVAVPVPGSQHALAPEPDPLERPLRAAVARVGPGRQPLDTRAAGTPAR